MAANLTPEEIRKKVRGASNKVRKSMAEKVNKEKRMQYEQLKLERDIAIGNIKEASTPQQRTHFFNTFGTRVKEDTFLDEKQKDHIIGTFKSALLECCVATSENDYRDFSFYKRKKNKPLFTRQHTHNVNLKKLLDDDIQLYNAIRPQKTSPTKVDAVPAGATKRGRLGSDDELPLSNENEDTGIPGWEMVERVSLFDKEDDWKVSNPSLELRSALPLQLFTAAMNRIFKDTTLNIQQKIAEKKEKLREFLETLRKARNKFGISIERHKYLANNFLILYGHYKDDFSRRLEERMADEESCFTGKVKGVFVAAANKIQKMCGKKQKTIEQIINELEDVDDELYKLVIKTVNLILEQDHPSTKRSGSFSSVSSVESADSISDLDDFEDARGFSDDNPVISITEGNKLNQMAGRRRTKRRKYKRKKKTRKRRIKKRTKRTKRRKKIKRRRKRTRRK